MAEGISRAGGSVSKKNAISENCRREIQLPQRTVLYLFIIMEGHILALAVSHVLEYQKAQNSTQDRMYQNEDWKFFEKPCWSKVCSAE